MDFDLHSCQQSDLFDAVTDLMAVSDLELRIQWANRAAGESVGEDPENLLGRSCYQVWHGRDTPCEQCPVQSTIQTGMHHKGEVESPDGKIFLIKSYPLRTPEGELKGIIEVTSDITEYRKAEKHLRRQSEEQALLLESVPTQIWYLTDSETYGTVNQAHADFYGLSREEMEYRKLWDFFPEGEARVCLNGNIQVFQSGKQIRTEEWLHNASGEQRLMEIIKTPKLDASGKVEYVVCSGSDITERKRLEHELREQNNLQKRAEEALRKKSWELEERVKELDCLYRLSRLLEQPAISRQDLMQSAVELIPFGWQYPDMACARLLLDDQAFYSRDFRETSWKQSADIVVNGNKAGHIEVFYLRKAPEGEEGPFLREERELIENISKSLGQYLEREQTKEALRRSESYYRAVFESSGTAMFIIEPDTSISLVNSNFERLSGYSQEEVEGRMSWKEFIHPEDVVWMKEYHYLRRHDPDAAPRQYECRFIDRRGQKRDLLLSVNMIPETSQSIASGVDITEHKRAEKRAYSLAYFDKLTGLPNRELFLDFLGQAVSRSKRMDECGAMLLVNIERLKSVNETLGEQAGNEVIREVGRRIWDTIREQDTVARVSGDEFMILAEGIDSGENARKLGLRVLERIGGELELPHRRFYPEARIGFTLFPHGGTGSDRLIKQADMALSGAKKSGNRIQQFTGDEEGISRKFHLEQDLKSALANEEFILCYQPQIDLQSDKIVGLEALIRWNHPQRGLVSPGEFIPLLERSGMIASVDAWVIRRVCEHLGSWRDEGFLVRTSVNLSARDLVDDSIIGVISSALEEYRLPAEALGVELTETELMENVDRASGILRTLSGWGIRVALDDFGKGYSCLSYLQRLDIHVIKIDKEFVAGMLENADSLILVQTIIVMAHNLGKEVLAEGVERQEQRQKLCEMGCDYGQGFLWSRPQPVEDLTFTAS